MEGWPKKKLRGGRSKVSERGGEQQGKIRDSKRRLKSASPEGDRGATRKKNLQSEAGTGGRQTGKKEMKSQIKKLGNILEEETERDTGRKGNMKPPGQTDRLSEKKPAPTRQKLEEEFQTERGVAGRKFLEWN